jgi:tetrahydromethanopterin S-methyltransferase subunit G
VYGHSARRLEIDAPYNLMIVSVCLTRLGRDVGRSVGVGVGRVEGLAVGSCVLSAFQYA